MKGACLRAGAALLCLAVGPVAAEGGTFGAISWSSATGRHGYSFNYPSSGEAEARALQECRNQGAGDCVVALTLSDGCGALAAGGRNVYAALGDVPAEAERRASEGCRRQEGSCRVVRVFCTGETAHAAGPATPRNEQPRPIEPPRRGSAPEALPEGFPAELREALPEPLRELAEGARRMLEGRDIGPWFVGFIALLILVQFLRGIARVLSKVREQLDQAVRVRPTKKTADWILDHHPTPLPAHRPEPPKRSPPSRQPPLKLVGSGPVEGAILRREAAPAVVDTNRARRHYREVH